MLVEHNQTQTHNPMTHKTIVNGGFEIKCLYGGDLSCQGIIISRMAEKARSVAAFAVHIKLRLTTVKTSID